MVVYTLSGILSILSDEYYHTPDSGPSDKAVVRRVFEWLSDREDRLAAEPLIDMEAPGLDAETDEEIEAAYAQEEV